MSGQLKWKESLGPPRFALGREPGDARQPLLAVPKRQSRPQIRWDYPLNLSILLSGGKENNSDSLSSGERNGRSPAPNPFPDCIGVRELWC